MSQRQRGRCPICHRRQRRQRLTRDGRLGDHWWYPDGDARVAFARYELCPGWGRLPERVAK